MQQLARYHLNSCCFDVKVFLCRTAKTTCQTPLKPTGQGILQKGIPRSADTYICNSAHIGISNAHPHPGPQARQEVGNQYMIITPSKQTATAFLCTPPLRRTRATSAPRCGMPSHRSSIELTVPYLDDNSRTGCRSILNLGCFLSGEHFKYPEIDTITNLKYYVNKKKIIF